MDLAARLNNIDIDNWSWSNPDKMNFPNIPTPPSSNEVSPQPLYFVASPGSNYFKNEDSLNTSHVYVPNDTEMNQVPQQGQPYLEFIEQPVDKFRFRYKSEMAGTHGSLNGQNSDKTRKQTFPTVQLMNCAQKAIIRCSIYQINSYADDIKPHAHRLIKKYGKDEVDDPHQIEVGPEKNFQATFHNMGIIHTAKKHIVTELMKKKCALKLEIIQREDKTRKTLTETEKVVLKQEAESESKSINLNIVCLRFDAFVKHNDVLFPICPPIFSHGINNLKSALTGELKIVRLDHCTSPAKGNREIFLLVERVTKKNIKIRFYEVDDEQQEVWEDYGRFTDLDVHHQYAIVFKTPPYRDVNITSKVKVLIELLRPTDGARSEPKEFTYIPSENMYRPGAKRLRGNASSSTSYDSSNYPSNEIPATVNPPTGNSFDQMEVISFPFDSVEFESMYNDVLKSNPSSDLARMYCTDGVSTQTSNKRTSSLVSKEDEREAQVVLNEIRNCLKSNPTPDRIQKLLQHYLGEDGKTNALHTFILDNNNVWAFYLMNLLFKHTPKLFNVTNFERESYLHLAVRCNNSNFVKNLFATNQVDVSIENGDQETPLHLACKYKTSIEVLEELISHGKNNLDVTNNNGDTPLILAIDNKRMSAIKLLINNGADVNKQHNNNGYTPLRFAIEKHYLEAVDFILSCPKLDAFQKDFNGINALEAALINDSTPTNINQLVKTYMEKHEINVVLKQEPNEEPSDDEMEIDLDPNREIKEEIDESELKIMYNKVKSFTPEALDEISAILDRTGSAHHLTDLLDLTHLLRSGIFKQEELSKNVLRYAVETNKENLWDIRDFISLLGEQAAVSIMDEMVNTVYRNI